MAYPGKKSAVNSIPPRWLKCPRKASDLIEGKFLAFKTPLSNHYDKFISEEFRFYPSMLLSSMSSYKVKIGLWIDLTNTSRFYDSEDIESAGTKYVKLQCRGHGECPSEEQTKTFIDICNNFTAKHPHEIIAVHCTHGFNRTGFLVCAYLVENQSWSIEAAVASFSKVRQPGIYKQDYLHELFNRYGDVVDTPAPVIPDWCLEYDDREDDDGEGERDTLRNSDCDNDRKKKREIIKKNPIFMEGVPDVVPITPPKLLQIQSKCQAMCSWKSKGFPGSQPVSMDCNNIALLQKMPYKVSWKADGIRYMMLIDGENEVYFIDRDNCVFHVSNMKFPRRKAPHQHIENTLLDGEMVIDHIKSKAQPRYLIYDIIQFEKQEVGKADFDRRLLCINKEIIGARQQALSEGKIDRAIEPFGVRLKPFFELQMTKDLLDNKFTSQLSHEIDGLIFQPAKDPYVAGRCMSVLKWKPPHMNSVDFKLVIQKVEKEGMKRENIGYLFVGGMDTPFAVLKLTKDLHKYDKKIIECKYEKSWWVFMRERTDKSFPNSVHTARAVCESIINPVDKEKLLHFIDSYRFGVARRPAETCSTERPAKIMKTN